MKSLVLIFLRLVIIPFFILLSSCKESGDLINPVAPAKLSVEIIPYENAPQEVDSSLYYKKMFVSWNVSNSLHDTLKADSLAKWFAESEYKLTDMWFPHVVSRCAYKSITDNIVNIKLSQPDTSLKIQGYSPTSYIASVCYSKYRHYKFSRE